MYIPIDKVHKSSKSQYLREILNANFSLIGIKYWFSLIGYIALNMLVGRKKAKIGRNCNIHPTVIIREGQNIEIGDNCYFNHNTILTGGHNSGKLIIGNNVLTGPNVGFYVANHHYIEKEQLINKQGYDESDIIIGDDVWIGANSIITSGVRIGSGVVIGANSVVTHDIPEYSIAAGVPAKIITSRK